MRIKVCPPKDPEERVPLTFNFSDEVAGDPIVSASIVVTLLQGADGSAALTRDGEPLLLVGRVQQWMQAGLSGVTYQYRCKAVTQLGRILVAVLIVPVQEIA